MFVVIIGGIALTLAFFLLSVSTTQSIRENEQEYGCLRAIGITRREGLRMAMYEAFSIIFTAIILGTIIGFVIAAMVSA